MDLRSLKAWWFIYNKKDIFLLLLVGVVQVVVLNNKKTFLFIVYNYNFQIIFRGWILLTCLLA